MVQDALIEPASPSIEAEHSRCCREEVIDVQAWTAGVLSFRITRPPGFRFVPGHYARLGLTDDSGEIVWRPFSMVSGTEDAFLEFLVGLVADGKFSNRLSALVPGDSVLIDTLSYGFLTVSQLAPGRSLWLLASGSGLGPFLSILRDPQPWLAFDHIVLAHSVRQADELVYREEIAAIGRERAAAGTRAALRYVPIVTRESWPDALPARIPVLIADGRLERAAGVELDVATARVMVCGNPDLTRDMRHLLVVRGFAPSRRGILGQMAFEKYW